GGDPPRTAGSLRGAPRTSRRGAGAGDRWLPALGWARLDRGMRDPRYWQGGVLLRDDQSTGPAGRRGVAGARKVGDLRAAVAQIDALSSLLPALGSAADLGGLYVRGRGPAIAARPGSDRTDHSRSPFPVTGRDLRRQRGR